MSAPGLASNPYSKRLTSLLQEACRTYVPESSAWPGLIALKHTVHALPMRLSCTASAEVVSGTDLREREPFELALLPEPLFATPRRAPLAFLEGLPPFPIKERKRCYGEHNYHDFWAKLTTKSHSLVFSPPRAFH